MSVHSKLLREVAALDLPDAGSTPRLITEDELAALPEAAQRYFHFMNVVGRPQDTSFHLGFAGRFRRRANEGWMACEAWQFSLRAPMTRVFYLQIRFGGLLPVLGRDTYTEGHGRMLIRLLDLVTVGDGQGVEYDIGELVTFLNDAVLIAPSMLLTPNVQFLPVDATTFDVTLTDHGQTVRARVFTDADGAPTDFSTTDRFAADPADPHKLTRARWTTPVDAWQEVDGRKLPTRARAIWHMPDGTELAYAELSPIAASLAFNVQLRGAASASDDVHAAQS
jgi:hypothetical protein